ncbi:MAG: glycine--tRNA ligase subunit beta [Candidatus Omnitrophica bacterium]|nr:glycine--tRNA ligase subunit beta [Candidatus Omnitrophota bacterium]
MSNLLVEIGTEELPETALHQIYGEEKTYTELGKRIYGILSHEGNRLLPRNDNNKFDPKQIKVEAAPRRIAFFVASLFERQADQTVEFVGPSYEKAYQGDSPTPALLGFLKSKNASFSEVTLKETPKGRFVSIKKVEKGKSADAVLPLILKDFFASLYFPKFMRWESTGFRFPRPIRWMVALLDSKVIPFEIAGMKSGRITFGHRFLSPKPIRLEKADWNLYLKALHRAHVNLSFEARKKIIRKSLEGRFHQKHLDEELLKTTAHLVEEPFLIDGTFLKTYLDLPPELLASCMKKNQKIFACYDAKGKLMSRFVAVLNGKRKGLSKIRVDYENVLESRLRDARYFYDVDIKEPLPTKGGLLKQLVYLGKLGTMADKTMRLEQLSSRLCHLLGRRDIQSDLKRVATLSKIDLMTHLVYEFPDLQGVAGREYALEAGEKETVARALEAQYLPRNLAEDYREIKKIISPLGALFGLMDRLDHLVGAFGIGLDPTGSQDPYALRRACGIFVKLIRAYRFHFSLTDLVAASFDLYGGKLEKNKKELIAKLTEFFKERVIFEIGVKAGTRDHEILQSIFKTSFDDIADVYERHEHLTAFYERDPEGFIKAAKVVERTGNIVRAANAAASTEVNPELLQETLERELYRLLQERSAEIQEATVRRDYEKATLLFGKIFYGPLNDFFNKVMVNVEDAQIRVNRQALMNRIHHLYKEKIADLSLLSKLE